MRSTIELKPDQFTTHGHLIRSTHRYPGGPVVGYIVTNRRRRRLIVHVRVDPTDSRAATPEKARRIARGWPDPPRCEMLLVTWADRDGIPRVVRSGSSFIGRTPVTSGPTADVTDASCSTAKCGHPRPKLPRSTNRQPHQTDTSEQSP
jgi:hypothetical protein